MLGFSRQRIETQRRTAFRSHYGLDVFYCQPGIEGAHEKGGVEGQVRGGADRSLTQLLATALTGLQPPRVNDSSQLIA